MVGGGEGLVDVLLDEQRASCPGADRRQRGVELLDDDRCETERHLVEQQQRAGCSSAPARSRAPAARRPTAGPPSACAAARAAGTCRPPWTASTVPAAGGSAPTSRFSSTDRLGKIRRPSGTRAMPRATRWWAGTPSSDRPSKRMSPAGDGHRAGDRLQQRRLAGAVGADDGDGSPGADGDRDVEQRLEVAVAGVDVVDLEQRHVRPRRLDAEVHVAHGVGGHHLVRDRPRSSTRP